MLNNNVHNLVLELFDAPLNKNNIEIMQYFSDNLFAENEAMYFSHARQNLQTDIAYIIMHRV